MSHTTLLLIAAAGVATLLLLILRAKVQPFVALVVVSIGVALTAGVPAADLVKTIEDGMGSTLGHIATIIALGAMIGRIVELSGGAAAFAHSLIDRFGSKRTPLALTVAGFVLGIPVFFEVGLIILMPIAYGVARASRKPLLVYALPMGAAMLTVHAFLPPHPGAVAVAQAIGADQGLVLLMGIPVTAVVILLGYLISRRMTRREYPMDPDLHAEIYGEETTLEAAGHPVPPERLEVPLPRPRRRPRHHRPHQAGPDDHHRGRPPALLRHGPHPDRHPDPADPRRHPRPEPPRRRLRTARRPHRPRRPHGGPADRRGAVRVRPRRPPRLGPRPHRERDDVALPPVAMVILVAGAGGVFGKVLVASGIGDAIADVLDRSGLPALVLAFLTALALRAAQGSATVALITTAGILAPLLQRADLSTGQLSLVALAMGAGGLAVSHINDAGYWMFTKLAGLDVASGLRTWTVLTTVMGVLGFGLTAALWPLV